MLIRRQRIAIEAAVIIVASTWLIIYTVYTNFAVTNPNGQTYWISGSRTANAPWNPWQLATLITIAFTGLTIAITPLLGRYRSVTRIALSSGLLIILATCTSIFVADQIYYKPFSGGLSYRYTADFKTDVWDAWETVGLVSITLAAMTVATALLLSSRRVTTAGRLQRVITSCGLHLIAATCLFPCVGSLKVHDAPPREIASSGGGTITCGCGSITVDQHYSFLLSVDGAILWQRLLTKWIVIAALTIGAVLFLRIRNRRRIIQQPALAQ